MGDFDEFYIFDNFIGYTGNLFGSPTLYFLTKTHHGRITIDHNNKSNIGRARPKTVEGYIYENRWLKINAENKWRPCDPGEEGAEWRLFEEQGPVVHPSRNQLIECTSDHRRDQVKAHVLYLISKNTALKKKDAKDE